MVFEFFEFLFLNFYLFSPIFLVMFKFLILIVKFFALFPPLPNFLVVSNCFVQFLAFVTFKFFLDFFQFFSPFWSSIWDLLYFTIRWYRCCWSLSILFILIILNCCHFIWMGSMIISQSCCNCCWSRAVFTSPSITSSGCCCYCGSMFFYLIDSRQSQLIILAELVMSSNTWNSWL